VKGYIGNYKVKINAHGKAEAFEASTVIVATGMEEIEPAGLYEYGNDPRIVTQLQLDGMLKENKITTDVKNVVIINCVNSKNELRGCCNIGCYVSVKNALAIKEMNKDTSVHILYRDLSMMKEEGYELERAKRSGIKFIRFPDSHYPELKRKMAIYSCLPMMFLLERTLTYHLICLFSPRPSRGVHLRTLLKGI